MSNHEQVNTDEQPKRHSSDKPVTTKDIANLYSHLQTMIDNVPKSPPRLDIEETTFPLTPTSSSSIIPSISMSRKLTPKEPDCPCHHIIVSKDSKHCGLCDDVIPVLSQLQYEVKTTKQENKKYKESLNLEKENSKTFDLQLNTVEKKISSLNEKLNMTNEKYNSLGKDLKVLKDKLEKEKKETEKAKQEKKQLENELEDLSQKLFEEANNMVANEKKEKHELQNQYDHLQQELIQCQQQLEAEEEQLKELKNKLGEKQEPVSVNCIPKIVEIDSMLLLEFQDFINSDPTKKLHSIPFMKNCLLEDVEPCLRFGPSSRLSTRKLYEAISLNTCFIEESPHGYSTVEQQLSTDIPLKISAFKNLIWERSLAISGCQACGRVTDSALPYRFRISVMDDWAGIDTFCRDRLVAVCEFYLFIRNTRQGYYEGRTLNELYEESVQLRLGMFYARMGTLSQKPLAAATETLGDTVTETATGTTATTSITDSTKTDMYTTFTNKPRSNETDSLDSSNSSTSSNEDDAYFPKHPGNSVWVQHSFL